MEKMFFEKNSAKYAKTLAAAKTLHKFPYVYRIWMAGDRVIGKAVIHAYGETYSTIKMADDYIAKNIKKE